MDLLDLALEVAREAGALVRARSAAARTGVGTKSSATDVVTDADRESERLIVGRIAAARPRDAILAEESGGSGAGGELRWVVDPLDGTVNFLYGIPHACVSVACEDEEGAVCGVVHDPFRDETFAAVRGGGATLNAGAIRVGDATEVAHALMATGFSYRSEERAVQAAITAHLLPRVRDIRRAGSAALDLAWTACGRVDWFFEAGLAPWDRAAGELIVREAGGRVEHVAVLEGHPGVLAAPLALFDACRALVEDGMRHARARG